MQLEAQNEVWRCSGPHVCLLNYAYKTGSDWHVQSTIRRQWLGLKHLTFSKRNKAKHVKGVFYSAVSLWEAKIKKWQLHVLSWFTTFCHHYEHQPTHSGKSHEITVKTSILSDLTNVHFFLAVWIIILIASPNHLATSCFHLLHI